MLTRCKNRIYREALTVYMYFLRRFCCSMYG